jgi:hypothetical protein
MSASTDSRLASALVLLPRRRTRSLRPLPGVQRTGRARARGGRGGSSTTCGERLLYGGMARQRREAGCQEHRVVEGHQSNCQQRQPNGFNHDDRLDRDFRPDLVMEVSTPGRFTPTWVSVWTPLRLHLSGWCPSADTSHDPVLDDDERDPSLRTRRDQAAPSDTPVPACPCRCTPRCIPTSFDPVFAVHPVPTNRTI